jgi:hypothetical protein
MPKSSKRVRKAPVEEEEEVEEVEEVEGADEEEEEQEEDADEEEDEEADEEEEDEEEEEAPRTAKAKDRARKRKERGKRVRNRVIGLVIIVILVGAIAATYLYTPPPTSVDVRVFNDPTTTGVNLIVSTTSSAVRGYTGKVNLRTSVNGTMTMNKDFSMTDNVGHPFLAYSDFVTRNGIYDITANIGGVKGTTQVTISNVVEDIAFNIGHRDTRWTVPAKVWTNVTISMTFIRWTSATTNDSVIAKSGQSISLVITDPSGHTSTKPNLDVSNRGLIQYNFDAFIPGTYSVNATFINNHIQPGAKYWSVSKTSRFMVNERPMSVPGPDQTVTLIPGSTVTVKVDGSGSVDDGAITKYVWNFGVYENDPVNYGKDTITSDKPTAEWKYAATGDYEVTLTVWDNGYPGITNTSLPDGNFLTVSVI